MGESETSTHMLCAVCVLDTLWMLPQSLNVYTHVGVNHAVGGGGGGEIRDPNPYIHTYIILNLTTVKSSVQYK